MPLRLANLEEPIPGYKLLERLGRGGFGEVWKAEAPGGLHKAIKFVYGELDAVGDDSKGAEQEWKALNRVKTIRHPFILSLERFDIIDGQLIIVMELADRNLWDRFRECRSQNLPGVPRDELLQYLEEAAEALDLMNTQYQLQHLDIKPQNLFLVHNHVKVADFGLAKDLEGMRATITGGVTPVYAAPETFDGWVSRFSDQYSLAIVYQELLTGSRPYNGTNRRQLLMQHISGTPDLASLPESERPVIGRSLEKKPEDRFPSCTDMVRALIQAGEGENTTDTPVARNGETQPFNPASVAGSGPVTHPMTGARPGREARMLPTTPTVPVPSFGGGMPGLVTQSQVFRSQGVDDDDGVLRMTQQRPHVLQTARMHELGLAPPEQTGDGVLFPALVVGLGHTGLIVLQQLRQAVHDRFGPGVTLPHLHYLHIDTDAETLQEATSAAPPVALTPREVLLARLHRPGHYLKREGMPPVESWLSSHQLYRLPRQPATVGVRAFGRLALCDNYRGVVARIRQELESFLHGDVLAEADRQTGLGVRSNRPRVYIATGLGGGTGSGMFLDLAYILRHEMRSVGYTRPEVTGVFFLPPAERGAVKSQAVANAYAALTELHHFSAPGVCFETRYDNREPPVLDAEPPFTRAVFLTLSRAHDLNPLRRVAGQAAGALFQEILTPVGRVIEECRSSYSNAHPADGLNAQTFGLFRLTWPRQRLLEAAARGFAQATLVRWMSKDAGALREPVARWVEEEWERRQLDLEPLVNRLQLTPGKDHLSAEQIVEALLEPLQAAPRFDVHGACKQLDHIFRTLGRPDGEREGVGSTAGDLFAAHVKTLVKECELKVAEMAVYFIEEPMFRLAGAEEAIAQLADKLNRVLETLEPLAADLTRDLEEAHGRLFPMIGALDALANDKSGKARAAVTGEVIELMRTFVRTRYRHLTVASVVGIYRGLLGNAPEYLREVQFCRLRLGEFARNVAAKSRGGSGESSRGHGHYILPPGCRTVNEAADLILGELDRDDVVAFEKAVQAQIRRQLRALAHVCLETGDHSATLKAILEEQAMAVLNKRLETASPAAMFFRYRDPGQHAQREIRLAYEEAAPELTPTRPRPGSQVCVLAVPDDPDGETFRQLAHDVLAEEELVFGTSVEDIVFYREQRHVTLTDLPQTGPAAREAYDASRQAEGQSPHSRGDVPWKEIR